MTSPLRIGLTGGIASGKSTAAQRFLELGIPVVDADESARLVVAPGTRGLAEVTAKFGANLLTLEGELDRRSLRSLVFSDPQLRRELESMLHPLIRADMERRAAMTAGPYMILAVPLLIENPGRYCVDRLLVVDVDENTQLQRLLARDGGTLAQAQAVVAAQTSRARRLEAADDVLVNTGAVGELRRAVDDLHQRYLSLAKALGPRDDPVT